jgi:hypothetical protein
MVSTHLLCSAGGGRGIKVRVGQDDPGEALRKNDILAEGLDRLNAFEESI